MDADWLLGQPVISVVLEVEGVDDTRRPTGRGQLTGTGSIQVFGIPFFYLLSKATCRCRNCKCHLNVNILHVNILNTGTTVDDHGSNVHCSVLKVFWWLKLRKGRVPTINISVPQITSQSHTQFKKTNI